MPRFVLLEHHRGDVHWDFMIEHGAALRTWAIEEPLVPDRDLPARSLADHRRVYLEYEGPISGDRGTVRRVAEGTFEVRSWEPGRIVLELRGDQLAGLLEISKSETGSDDVRWIFRMRGKVA